MIWFKHYCKASRSNELNDLMDEYGAAGYGLYWLLVELCYEKWDGKSQPKFEIHPRVLKEKLRLSAAKTTKFLQFCAKVKLFHFAKHEKNYEIDFPKLSDILDKDTKYNRKRIAGQSLEATLEQKKIRTDKKRKEEEVELAPPSKENRESSFDLLRSVDTWDDKFFPLIKLELSKLEMQCLSPELVSEAFAEGTMAFLATYAAEPPLPKKFINSLRSHITISIGNVRENNFKNQESEIYNPDLDGKQ